MTNHPKYEQILDALQNLMESRSIQSISVSEIAQTAGMGKGSIYYYFPSKDAILDALIERNYEKPLETAKTLAGQTEISPFTRMAMIFQACRSSSSEFLRQEEKEPVSLTGAQGEIWSFTKVKSEKNLEVLHLINLQDVENLEWVDRNGTQTAPQVMTNVKVKQYVQKPAASVLVASPDYQQGMMQEVPFTAGSDDKGD